MDITDFTNEQILNIALRQSAIDACCQPDCFTRTDFVIAASRAAPGARKYLDLPFACNLISYGGNVVASAAEKYHPLLADYLSRFSPAHCFETPHLHVLNDALAADGLRVCFMAEYFLPDVTCLKALPCPYETRVLRQSDFTGLYTGMWSNALCEKRRELDVLGVGAYDGETLIGLAGCSADCEDMWQIGIDVLPEYRRQGVAAALTSRLALEIFKHGKVPFYCAAWSNIRSVRNAVKSGFRPAWVELGAKSFAYVDELNRKPSPSVT